MLEEEDKKLKEDETDENESGDDGEAGESGSNSSGTGNKSDTEDGNYIKKDEETKSEIKEEPKKNIFQELKAELHQAAEKLEDIIHIIRPKKKQERELDKEVGGTEVDYAAEKKAADEDKDIWDEKPKETPAMEIDGDSFETSANQSFIHSKKIGKGKRKGKLGPMTLKPDDPNKDKTSGKKGKGESKSEGKAEGAKPESKLSMVSRFTKRNNEIDHDGFSR